MATSAPHSSYQAPPPVIEPGHSYDSITEKISAIVLARKTPLGW